MNIRDIIAEPGSIVIVDDHLGEPDLSLVDVEVVTEWFQFLEEDAARVACIAELLGLPAESSAADVVGNWRSDLERLWAASYSGDASQIANTAPLFEKLRSTHRASRARLDTLIEFCKSELGTTPLTFPSLSLASESLKQCCIMFVDLYLGPGLSLSEAIQLHEQNSAIYRGQTTAAGLRRPRIVFLISSKLPHPDELEEFRRRTGVRSAFFHTIRKGDIDVADLKARVDRLAVNDGIAVQLHNYLESVCDATRSAAQSIIDELERLELHDLAMLYEFNLAEASENLQDYLTWLASEGLSTRLRTSLSAADGKALDLNEVKKIPLDGKIVPRSVLFELFSELARVPTSLANSRPAFGDVFAKVPRVDGALSEEVFLAISPACDLIRCSTTYRILCVNGTMVPADVRLEALGSKQSSFGHGSHLIKDPLGGAGEYSTIKWSTSNRLETLLFSDLSDVSRFRRVARLPELFAHEIKESTLRETGRVGLPQEPGYVAAATGEVRVQFDSKDQDHFERVVDLDSLGFVPMVVTKGRIDKGTKDAMIVAFTQQFLDWFRADLFPMLRRDVASQLEVLSDMEAFFDKPESWRHSIDIGRTPCIDKSPRKRITMHCALDGDFSCASPFKNGMQILVRAREGESNGSVTD